MTLTATNQREFGERLAAALAAAGLEVAVHRKAPGGRGWYETLDGVAIIGALYRAGYIVRERDAAPPARRPRLIEFRRGA